MLLPVYLNTAKGGAVSRLICFAGERIDLSAVFTDYNGGSQGEGD